jgi:hypothetical protein
MGTRRAIPGGERTQRGCANWRNRRRTLVQTALTAVTSALRVSFASPKSIVVFGS